MNIFSLVVPYQRKVNNVFKYKREVFILGTGVALDKKSNSEFQIVDYLKNYKVVGQKRIYLYKDVKSVDYLSTDSLVEGALKATKKSLFMTKYIISLRKKKLLDRNIYYSLQSSKDTKKFNREALSVIYRLNGGSGILFRNFKVYAKTAESVAINFRIRNLKANMDRKGSLLLPKLVLAMHVNILVSKRT